MTAPAADPAAEVKRLQQRERELEAEIKRLNRANAELEKAAETSRNFKASRDAGHVIDLDSWEPS